MNGNFDGYELADEHGHEQPGHIHRHNIPGLGKGEPMVVNDKGGRQSRLEYAFHLMDVDAVFAAARVLAEGAKNHGLWNWRDIDRNDHINHAIAHLFAALANDGQDDHLAHALVRVMFAYSVEKNPGYCPLMPPDDPREDFGFSEGEQ